MSPTPYPEPTAESSSRSWFALLFLLAAFYALFIRLHSSALLTFYEDDAFYYFQIARHIVAGHGSTFDGIHLTNGYHPLWMLVIVALTFLASGKAFFVLVQSAIFACFAATFFLIRSLLRQFSQSRSMADAASTAVSLGCLLLLRGGMEITLTLPLALLLCRYRLSPTFRWTPRTAILYGLLAATLILSRLDAILLVALLLCLDRPTTLRNLRLRALAAVSCAVPLSLYLFSNHHWFQTWTTVSSQAKQLRAHHGFTLHQVIASLEPILGPYRVLVVFPAVFVCLLCLFSLFRRPGSPQNPAATSVSAALLAFPFVQALAFFTLSDWLVWPWYLYSIPLAMTGGLLWLLSRTSDFPGASVLHALLLVIAFVYAAACTADRVHSRWYVFAEDLAPFARTHPGLYAMGDCAGTPAYVIGQPMLQLEGLAMDEPFLDNIRHQRNLNDVLAEYHVRYYVTQDADPVGACFRSVEPFQGGPDSPHMTGTFCRQPIASFQHGTGRRSTLRVFEVANSEW